MKKLLWAAFACAVASPCAWGQENIFSTHPGSNTVSIIDAQKISPLPNAANFGPYPIATAAAPSWMVYDPNRTQIYVINTTGATIMAIDPIRFTTRTISPPNLVTALTMGTLSPDGRFLYTVGGDSVAGKVGVYRVDLNDFTSAGITFVGGVVPNGTLAPVDVDVAQGKAYFSFTQTISNIGLFISYHIGQVDLSTGVYTDVFAVSASDTTNPQVFTRMTRSLDANLILVATQTAQTAGSVWQLLRIVPSNVPVVDVLDIPSPCSPSPVDDIVITTGVAPYTVCMLAAHDCGGYAPRFFTVGTTGNQSAETVGPAVPSGFGQVMTPDLAHNRIFFAHAGSTAFPNAYQVLSPPTAAGVFIAGTPPSTGSAGPQCVVTAPAPPPMTLTGVTQPAGIVVNPFQIEMFGSGFIQGSSRGRLNNPANTNFFATSTQVINSGRLIATFAPIPAPGGITHYSAGVANNDGQTQMFPNYYQGLPAVPQPGTLAVTIPPLVQGYRMLSFPEYLTVGDLRAAVAAQLGVYNPIFFRIFVWQTDHYMELNNSKLAASTSLMGNGVFAISRDGASLVVPAPDLSLNSTFLQRTVVLHPGWNMVSQPWINGPTNTMNYANLSVHLLDDLSDAAVAATISGSVSNVLYEAVSGAYVTSTTMSAGRAYWVLNLINGPVYLVFDQAQVNLKTMSALQATATSATPPPQPGNSLDDGGGGGGCGLMGAEALLVLLFLRGRGRRRLAA